MRRTGKKILHSFKKSIYQNLKQKLKTSFGEIEKKGNIQY